MNSSALFIHNRWTPGEGPLLQSHDPVYGTLLWEGASASVTQTEQAISLAAAASTSWSKIPFSQRAAIVLQFKSLLMNERNALALTISQETGKVFWEAQGEVDSMINKIDIAINAYGVRTGHSSKELSQGICLQVEHRPLGVMGVIGPYNFPAHIPNGQIVPALLAGNAVIFKISELTPKTGHAIARLWLAAGIPENVLVVIIGGAEVAKTLVSDPRVNGILFTGSYSTGAQIHAAMGGAPNRLLALEMGGNNPLIVSTLSHIPAAVLTTLLSAFATSGQRCTCTRRLILIDNPQNKFFLDTLIAASAQISVGAYDASPQPFISSVIRPKVAQDLLAEQDKLVARGADSLLPMQLIRQKTGMLSPGILDVTEVTHREDREIFGPLLQVIRVPNFESALQEANNTQYGLTAGLLSTSQEEFQQFRHTVRAGVINWNRPTTGASSEAPFGGVGFSGNYRPAGFYMADSCAYPIASLEQANLTMPATLPAGLPFFK